MTVLALVAPALATHLDVALATDAPVSAGARATWEVPGRVRVELGLGWMPGAYLDAINGVAVAAAWYDEPTAALIDAALQDALVVRAHGGWRPFERHGFFVSGGYQLATLGGGLSGADAVSAATGESLPAGVGEELSFRAAATVHMVDAVVGWEWLIRERVVVRADVGGSFTVGAESTVEREFETGRVGDQAVDGFEEWAEDYLDETFTTYVHTPTVGVSVGWRFGP